jgi:hypothetical protein
MSGRIEGRKHNGGPTRGVLNEMVGAVVRLEPLVYNLTFYEYGEMVLTNYYHSIKVRSQIETFLVSIIFIT